MFVEEFVTVIGERGELRSESRGRRAFALPDPHDNGASRVILEGDCIFFGPFLYFYPREGKRSVCESSMLLRATCWSSKPRGIFAQLLTLAATIDIIFSSFFFAYVTAIYRERFGCVKRKFWRITVRLTLLSLCTIKQFKKCPIYV